MNMLWLKEKIRARAFELGFSYIGFAKAEALEGAPLLNWLLGGYQADMAYMGRDPEARLDPRKIFPGCQTVISLGLNYYTPFPTKANKAHGRISRYAWGRDYHKVMRKKLKALGNEILRLAPEAKVKICVDTSPILEKVWAQKAGIGWQGKHSNVITRNFGSWIFLGEILTTLVLNPDLPHPNFCGTCTRCIEACPTGAIVAPYVVDANRCISYHTIEAKENPPLWIQQKIGDWIFGCDICQEVCPWNKFAQTTGEEDFFPRLENQIPLETWGKFDAETFLKKFAGTPLMRPGLTRMAENARTALTNQRLS